ncbi:MAG: hypothetical protein K5773_07255 [Pseudobutyrivibrio sp.]|nr:hypothetical protein [Pseudobutyrivibrio sp.]
MQENFEINENKKDNEPGQLNMLVSSICHNENGDKYAFITFSDDIRTAEGKIPDCKIIKNQGFAEIEVASLEKYMQENLQELKKMAAKIDIFTAFTS